MGNEYYEEGQKILTEVIERLLQAGGKQYSTYRQLAGDIAEAKQLFASAVGGQNEIIDQLEKQITEERGY